MILDARGYPIASDFDSNPETVIDTYGKVEPGLVMSMKTLDNLRSSGFNPGRMKAWIPRALWVYLNKHAPEILRNRKLFYMWLKRNRAYALHKNITDLPTNERRVF